MINIRFATVEDVPRIGYINYTAWHETYRGIVDDTFLDAMSIEQMERKWKGFFHVQSKGRFLVVEDEESVVAGYCCAGALREPLHDFDSEIYALYLLKQHQGKGWGKALWLAAIKELQGIGLGKCCVYVLKDNPAVGFYRWLKPDWEGITTAKLGDKDYAEVILGWHNFEKFANHSVL